MERSRKMIVWKQRIGSAIETVGTDAGGLPERI